MARYGALVAAEHDQHAFACVYLKNQGLDCLSFAKPQHARHVRRAFFGLGWKRPRFVGGGSFVEVDVRGEFFHSRLMSLRGRWLSRRCSFAVSKPRPKQSPLLQIASTRASTLALRQAQGLRSAQIGR